MDAKKHYLSLIFFLLVVFVIELGGQWLTATSVTDWYLTLKKPSWTPPSWLFGPVWTLLYILIAISGWLIYTKVERSHKKTLALIVYAIQLFFNLIWSYFFFFLKSPSLALIDISLLAILILINILLFLRLYRSAGVLLIPYFIWVLYAASLNFGIWSLNP